MRVKIFSIALGLLLLGGCADRQDQPATEGFIPSSVANDDLPNAYRVTSKVISGGQPHGEGGFLRLRDLGVRTIISVDGAKPNLQLAKKFGLRYVHLPHGYDGVPADQAKRLAKAVRDLPGPIYIHCHHGKHRSPAATAVACIGAGMITPGDGSSLLRLAGTSSHYQGLFQSVARAELFSDNTLDEAADDFPESVDVPPLAQAMVSMEQVFDRLKELDRQGWKHLANHPDIDAAHEALMLREHLTELLRTDEVKSQPDGFIEVLRSSEAAASKLESSLAAWRQHSDGTDDASPSPGDLATVRQSLQKIGSDCTACHRAYRDVPKGRPAQHEAFRSAS